MTRSIFAAALAAAALVAGAAGAEPSNPNAGYTPNEPGPAQLSAPASISVRALIGDVALDNLNSAQVGAINALLGSRDSEALRGSLQRIVNGPSATVELSADAYIDGRG